MQVVSKWWHGAELPAGVKPWQKAQPQVTTERLAEPPGTGVVIFGISVLVSSFFRCEVSLFDSPSITQGTPLINLSMILP